MFLLVNERPAAGLPIPTPKMPEAASALFCLPAELWLLIMDQIILEALANGPKDLAAIWRKTVRSLAHVNFSMSILLMTSFRRVVRRLDPLEDDRLTGRPGTMTAHKARTLRLIDSLKLVICFRYAEKVLTVVDCEVMQALQFDLPRNFSPSAVIMVRYIPIEFIAGPREKAWRWIKQDARRVVQHSRSSGWLHLSQDDDAPLTDHQVITEFYSTKACRTVAEQVRCVESMVRRLSQETAYLRAIDDADADAAKLSAHVRPRPLAWARRA